VLRAVVFDLYGTLIRLEDPRFTRGLPGRLGVGRRAWTEFVRRVGLVTPFASREAFVERMLAELVPQPPAGLREDLLAELDAELDAVRPLPGARPALRFLKRRGLRLGLISNLASPYREPFEQLGFGELFDAVAFSCAERRAKPDAGIYLELCRRLAVAPEEALMVGDSLANDVIAPRRIGLRSLRAGERWEEGKIPAAGVGWLELTGGREFLLEPGREISVAGERVRLGTPEPVPDRDQGRYNLVLSADVESAGGRVQRVFFKRFLFPESAHVEHFVHALCTEVGVPTYPVGILAGREPIFWSFQAPGKKLERPAATPELAFEIGRHCAAAFLFANADLRPRNAFLVAAQPRPRLVMVDHEHCLFNLALDLTGIPDPLNPHALDALGRDALRRRVVKQVLSPLAMRRARRTFLDTRAAAPELVAAFRRGWIELHQRARQRRARLGELLRERIYTEPFLIIGTHAYRRAMAGIDLDDLLSRIDLDPVTAVEACL